MQTETELSNTIEADKQYTWHPYTQHHTRPAPLEISRAAGAYLFTAEGRGIFDAISSWWVTTHGHAQPEIADAIAEQARTLDHAIFTHFTHEPAALLAEELVKVLPTGLTRVFYSDDGSTAVEAAIKMALQFYLNRDGPKQGSRRLIASFSDAYHGDTFGAMSVSERGIFTAPFADHLFEVAAIVNPTQGDTVAAFAQLIEREKGNLAALIVEPLLMGTAGMLMYSEDILVALRKLCSDNDILLIADEVLTGFGRTGPLFATEKAGISPDIICLSKGITGGFLPLGATVATEEIFSSFLSEDRRRTLFHGHSYTANPIACTAARVSLSLLNEESTAQRHLINATHRQHLDRLKNHSSVKNARTIGTVAAFDIMTSNREGASEMVADSNPAGGYLDPVGSRLAAYALERDILLRPLGNVVYILPPYCSTADDLANVYSVIENFLDAGH